MGKEDKMQGVQFPHGGEDGGVWGKILLRP